MIDLWPENIPSHTSLKAPVTILKEQGTLLGRKTNNLVEGVITSYKGAARSGEGFRYDFYLVAPALSDYRYFLLGIYHYVDFYPLVFSTDSDVLKELPDELEDEQNRLIANTPAEFMDILKAIFATKKVRRVIEAIIAQSSGHTEPE